LGLDERDFELELREETALGAEHHRDDKRSISWKKFGNAIKKLNEKAPINTAYKVLYLARHGQGYHVRLNTARQESLVHN
jgi:hypothetical protein